jgi:hypothetical protein
VDIGLGWIKALAVQIRAFCAPIRRWDRDPSCPPPRRRITEGPHSPSRSSPGGRGGVGVPGTAMTAALFLLVASFVVALPCGSGPCSRRRLICPPGSRCRARRLPVTYSVAPQPVRSQSFHRCLRFLLHQSGEDVCQDRHPSATRGTLEVPGQLPRVLRLCYPAGRSWSAGGGSDQDGDVPDDLAGRDLACGTTAMSVSTPTAEGGVGDVARQGATPGQLMR